MTRAPAGQFDRRIEVQRATEIPDAAGDPIKTWSTVFVRSARKHDGRGREFGGAQQQVRESETTINLRVDLPTRTIAPESHRFLCKGRIYEITAVADSNEREDEIVFLCSTRPDLQGARAPDQP